LSSWVLTKKCEPLYRNVSATFAKGQYLCNVLIFKYFCAVDDYLENSCFLVGDTRCHTIFFTGMGAKSRGKHLGKKWGLEGIRKPDGGSGKKIPILHCSVVLT